MKPLLRYEFGQKPITGILVIGVGGGGCNSVTHMYNCGIKDVQFLIANSDKQSLDRSPVPNKIQLGPTLCKGLGCGMNWQIGEEAAKESIDEIKEMLQDDITMVFITAGMGGGTGTGAAPIIAEAAKEMGILTVAIVTTPFAHEGRERAQNAQIGIENLRKHVDAILIIDNEKLNEVSKDLTFAEAKKQVDEVVFRATKAIAEIITLPGEINVDFADVRSVLSNAATMYLAIGEAEGQNRAQEAIENALSSPLVQNTNIFGARGTLVNVIVSENSYKHEEHELIGRKVVEAVGEQSRLIHGVVYNENMGEKIEIILLAAGFPEAPQEMPYTTTASVPTPQTTQEPLQPYDIPPPTSKPPAPTPPPNPTSPTPIKPTPNPRPAPPHTYAQPIPPHQQTPPTPPQSIPQIPTIPTPPTLPSMSLEQRILNFVQTYNLDGSPSMLSNIVNQIKEKPAIIDRKDLIQFPMTTDPFSIPPTPTSRLTLENDPWGNTYLRENNFFSDKAD